MLRLLYCSYAFLQFDVVLFMQIRSRHRKEKNVEKKKKT
jgi:hypothetical protein